MTHMVHVSSLLAWTNRLNFECRLDRHIWDKREAEKQERRGARSKSRLLLKDTFKVTAKKAVNLYKNPELKPRTGHSLPLKMFFIKLQSDSIFHHQIVKSPV